MDFNDYLEYYKCTTITQYHEGFISQSINIKQPWKSCTIVTIKLTEMTDLYVSICQINPWLLTLDARSKHEISPSRLILGKLEG